MGLKTIKCRGHGKAENTIYMADIRRKKDKYNILVELPNQELGEI